MAMSVKLSDEEEHGILSDINTTPLVDVMLVLLIIFLITIPVITHTIKVQLPKATNIPTVTTPKNIVISIDTEGSVYWNGALVDDRGTLIQKVAAEAVKTPQPEIHIKADARARYLAVGRTLFDIQRGGIIKIGFLTEPNRGMAR